MYFEVLLYIGILTGFILGYMIVALTLTFLLLALIYIVERLVVASAKAYKTLRERWLWR